MALKSDSSFCLKPHGHLGDSINLCDINEHLHHSREFSSGLRGGHYLPVIGVTNMTLT